VVGGAVLAGDPRPVHAEDHGEVLQRHVVDDVVVGALQEGGVDGHHRLHAPGGEPRGEGDPVTLGDPHVEVPVGEGRSKMSVLVPPGMAAVMATTRGSRRPSSVSPFPKTSW
jgi:hypothetical protein